MFMKKNGIDPSKEALAVWMRFTTREVDNAKKEVYSIWNASEKRLFSPRPLAIT